MGEKHDGEHNQEPHEVGGGVPCTEGGRRKEEGGRRTYVLRNERKKKRGIDTTFTQVLSMIFT